MEVILKEKDRSEAMEFLKLLQTFNQEEKKGVLMFMQGINFTKKITEKKPA